MASPFRALCLALLTLLLTRTAHAAPSLPIHLTVSATPSVARFGEVVTVTVHAVLDPGWHVYSLVPTPNGPSPAALLSLTGAVPAGPATEDAPVRKLDPNFGAVVGYHEGTATFQRAFRMRVGTPPIASFAIGFHYQTCNASLCLPPTDVLLPVPLTVGAGPVRPAFASVPAPPTAARAPHDDNIAAFLLAALTYGLLAIFTPCVFPLIPITLTNFIQQAQGSKPRFARLAVTYALGIVAFYVALGAVVAATLGASGANRIAANPYVNLIEFALFVLFALSFFEIVTFRGPSGLGALQQAARRHGGMAGLLLLGTTFVLGSFTCTAPFIGTLLVTASGGTWARPLLGMCVFALAFVSPFFVFALFPQGIAHLPKGGVWLARFKATLGFVELAAALKFLSNADQVWQWKLLTQPVLLVAWAMICLVAALYLFGPLRFGVVAETEEQGTPVPLSRRLIASMFVLAAIYCFWGLAGRPISPYLGAFLPPPGYGGVGGANSDGLPWLTNYQSALAQAKTEGKPLLVNFTGYTCTNCRLNEKRVFPSPVVQAALANYVRVELYTDGGKDGPANQSLQQSTFGDVALPLYGIIDPQSGHVMAKTEGVQTPDGFARFLARPAPPASASVNWEPYAPDAVAQAAQAQRPAVIDFTARWCQNCKVIEREVLDNRTVAPSLAPFATYRADLTQWNAPASVALQKRYGFTSLPTIVFLDKAGREIRSLRITGRLAAADFQHRLQMAQAR